MSSESIFTKIITREIPAHVIYEDEYTIAFLDIRPSTEGHTLVVPKQQVEFIWDLEEEAYQALMQSVQKVGRRLRDVIGQPYVGEMVIGTDVPHAHVHVIPFTQPYEMKRTLEQATSEPDHNTLAGLQKRLVFS